MGPLRFAMVGAGFWARYQLAGWREAGGCRCVAICNRTRSKAEALAREFDIPAIYTDLSELLRGESLDAVDVVSAPEAHEQHVLLAAGHKVPVICQKPMATSLAAAERMVEGCRKAGVPFFVHENWRWQTPIRALRRALQEGSIGAPFRGRITMISAYSVFLNQPFLRDSERFVLTDMGCHLLDTARLLFGEAQSLYCQTARVHKDIRGEDVATVMTRTDRGVTVVVSMGYAGNPLEQDRYPETYIFVEGDKGSARLGPDFWVRVTTGEGTHSRRYPPPDYAWTDPRYAVAQASIVPCVTDLMRGLRGQGGAETTGEDNLKTLRQVFAAYESAESGRAVRLA
jgi:predicted dehydrogenase